MPIAREMADDSEREHYLDMLCAIQQEHGLPRCKVAEMVGVTIGTMYRRAHGVVPITLEAYLALKQVHSELVR